VYRAVVRERFNVTERPLQAGDNVVAPDVVGLSRADAFRVASEAGVALAPPDPDGPPLTALTWPGEYVITGQALQAGTAMKWMESLVVSWRKLGPAATPGDPSGVREPRRPRRPTGSLAAEAQPPSKEELLEVTYDGRPGNKRVRSESDPDPDRIQDEPDSAGNRDHGPHDGRDG